MLEAIKPVKEFMDKWCCPNDILVVQQGSAELYSGEIAIPMEVAD